MMHARIRLARKPVAIALLPLFSLSCLSENCQSLRTCSLHTEDHHRLNRMSTGRVQCPSAGDKAIGCPSMAGRHSILPIGKNSLQKTVLTATRTDSVWHGIPSKCMHGHTPYHAMDSREHGPRSPGHQSRVSMHDGPKAKLATLISNEMQA